MLFFTKVDPKRSTSALIILHSDAVASVSLTYLFLSIILVHSQHCDVAPSYVVVMQLQFTHDSAHVPTLALGLKDMNGRGGRGGAKRLLLIRSRSEGEKCLP